MKRRKTQHRLRRRQYGAALEAAGPVLETVAGVSEGAAGSAGEPSTGSTKGSEVDALRARAGVAERAVAELNAKVDEMTTLLTLREEEVATRERAFQEAKKVVEEAKAQVLRSNQEMDLQRKRLLKEKEDVQKFAAEKLLEQLFPVLDNFAMAVESFEKGTPADTLVSGVVIIHRDMLGMLGQSGFSQVEAVGQPFDPRQHDAASMEADPSKPEGVVLRVLRPGYVLHDKVLRPAMVMVNRLPKAETPRPIEGAPVTPAPDLPADQRRPSDPDIQKPTVGTPKDQIIDPLERARRLMDTSFE